MSGRPQKWTMAKLRQRCKKDGECLLWAGYANVRTGYPQAGINGKACVGVRPFVFKELLKREVPPGQCVSTTCGRKLCLSPDHLVARTPGDVLRASYATGIRSKDSLAMLRVTMASPLRRLDPAKAREIRASDEPAIVLAERYGVHRETVNKVRRGESWRHKASAAASVFDWAESHREAA